MSDEIDEAVERAESWVAILRGTFSRRLLALRAQRARRVSLEAKSEAAQAALIRESSIERELESAQAKAEVAHQRWKESGKKVE